MWIFKSHLLKSQFLLSFLLTFSSSSSIFFFFFFNATTTKQFIVGKLNNLNSPAKQHQTYTDVVKMVLEY